MTSDQPNQSTSNATARTVITEPDFSGTPLPISDFACRADFPQSAHGAYIDIQGFAGVVVEIINHSIKVRSPEGITQRYNANRLKVLCAPAERHTEEEPSRGRTETKPQSASVATTESGQGLLSKPDFTAPVRPISQYASQPDFPQCVLGKHVDVKGLSGVVVGVVNGSVKLQTAEGVTRSYNADVLRKLHGKG